MATCPSPWRFWITKARRARRSGTVAFFVVISVCGLTSTATGTAARPREPIADEKYVVVTRDSPKLSSVCSPRRVASTVVDFFAAITSADEGRLRTLVSDDFQRFSLSEGNLRRTLRSFATRDGEELIQFLLQRREQDERVRLVMAIVSPPQERPGEGGIAGVVFYLERRARDLRVGLGGKERLAQGKGGINCAAQRIVRMNIAMELVEARRRIPGNIRLSSCPRPTEWGLKTGPAITCTESGSPPLAQEVSRNFVLPSATDGMPVACRAETVGERLISALRGFNLGRSRSFAAVFSADAAFLPAGGLPALGGRAAIARYAAARYRVREGWTLARLALTEFRFEAPSRAEFSLTVEVRRNGRLAFSRGVLATVGCDSALVISWK